MIEVANQHPRLKVDKRLLAKLLRETFAREKREYSDVSLLLVTDKRLATLHAKFLNDPTVTDVITFDVSNPDGVICGDIVVSLDRAKVQAAEFGATLKSETGRLAVHGALHLCGWDDATPAKRAKMHKLENQHLSASGWPTGD